jgi:hypothetical protein
MKLSEVVPRRMQLKAWRPLQKNTLRGFATVELPIGLVITDISVHTKNGKSWASFPAKIQIDKDGQPRTADGKIQYAKILEWRNRDLSDRFSDAVIQSVLAEYPDALDDGTS